MTEREPTPPDSKNAPSAATSTAGQPTKIGVYDAPGEKDASNRRLVGMYDRPERAGPSPMILIVAALVLLVLIAALVYFFFLRV